MYAKRKVLKPETPKRNRRNETTGTTGTTRTAGTKPPEIQLKGVTYRLWRVFSVKIQNLISNAGIGGKNYRLSPGRGDELKLWRRKEPADDMWLLLTVFPMISFRVFRWFCFGCSGGFVLVVSVVSVVSFRLFRWFRWFRWFRSGSFVSVFRVLVHATQNLAVMTISLMDMAAEGWSTAVD